MIKPTFLCVYSRVVFNKIREKLGGRVTVSAARPVFCLATVSCFLFFSPPVTVHAERFSTNFPQSHGLSPHLLQRRRIRRLWSD